MHINDNDDAGIEGRGLANTRHEIFHSCKHQTAIRGDDKIFGDRSLIAINSEKYLEMSRLILGPFLIIH